MPREHLPNRRDADVYDFEHGGIRYRAIVGLYEDGRPGEVFINPMAPVRQGSKVEAVARDTAVALSLAFQHGCSAEILRKAMTRMEEWTEKGIEVQAAGPGGALLDLMPKEQGHAYPV